MANELGKFLRQQRGEMPLRKFAAKCKISHTHLDSIEKGSDPRTGKPVSISTETLRLIADGLGINFVFLACLADGYRPEDVANAIIPVLSPEMQALIREMDKPQKTVLAKTGNGNLTDFERELVQAYDNADKGIQHSVKKLLDLDAKIELEMVARDGNRIERLGGEPDRCEIDKAISETPRPSQTLCKPPMWCRIEAPHWRFL